MWRIQLVRILGTTLEVLTLNKHYLNSSKKNYKKSTEINVENILDQKLTVFSFALLTDTDILSKRSMSSFQSLQFLVGVFFEYIFLFE